MIFPLSIALAAASPGAAQWRVAAVDDDEIAYVEPADVTRKGRKAVFLLMTVSREPEGVSWFDELVTLDCRSRKWRANGHWTEENGDFVTQTVEGRPSKGTFLGAVVDSVCKGKYRSGPIEDFESDARARLAAGK